MNCRLPSLNSHCYFPALTLPEQRDPESIRGFTLLELLIVVGIIATLLVLMAPAFTYIKGGTDFTSAAYTIKGVLDTARTYAKANNTYTFIGFAEVDSSVDPSVSPQSYHRPALMAESQLQSLLLKTEPGNLTGATSGQDSEWTANYDNGSKSIRHRKTAEV